MKYHFKIFALALLVSGCSALEQKFERPPYTLCDKSETLLMCDSADLENCWSSLEDKPIIIIEEKEL